VIAGTIVKMATGQIIWPSALALLVGNHTGAQFGGGVSKKVNRKHLRITIAFIITITGIKMWSQVIGQ